MNRTLKQGLIRGAHGVGWLKLKQLATRGGFRIVTYHGVDERDHPVINGDQLQTRPKTFEEQVVRLAKAFEVVDLKSAVHDYGRTGRWPDRGLAITFDDGYLNNAELAAPMLRRLGIPATFFVTEDFVTGRGSPWWYGLRQHLAESGIAAKAAMEQAIRLEAQLRPMAEAERERELARLGVGRGQPCFYPFMTREDCRALMAMGFDVQGHGKTHASFSGESPERVVEEIRASANFVKGLGGEPWAMAYPYGHAPARSDLVDQAMREAGFIAGLTTEEGINDRSADLTRLRRWDLHGGYSPLGALARVS